MDAVVLVVHQQLRKHNGPVGVHSAVCDPVLLCQRCGAVDDEGAGPGLPVTRL